MSILKLEVGSPITMQVKAVRPAEGKFGPQLAFDDEEGNTLFLSETSATRQLERIGYTVESAAGKTLLFEKVDKNGTKFVNINPAAKTNGSGAKGGAALPRQAGTTQPPAPTPRPASRQAVQDALDAEVVEFSDPLYLAIADYVVGNVVDRITTKMPMTPEATAACINTLYTQAKRNGH